MNKKLVAIASTITLGGGMLFATAFANATQTTGYDVYKSAIKNTKNVKNVTGEIKVSVKDNGREIVNVDSTAKINQEKMTMSNSTTVKVGEQKNVMNVYRQEGKTITKSSDSNVYNVIEMKGHRDYKHQDNPQIEQAVENVIDAAIGNLKDSVSVDNISGDVQEVKVQLTEGQIPPVANAVASLMAQVRANHEQRSVEYNKKQNITKDLEVNVPKLVSDIKIMGVDIKAYIKNNLIQNQTAVIRVTGKDVNGKSHDVTINVDANASNFNTTVPDIINLSGKQVKTVTPQDFRHEK